MKKLLILVIFICACGKSIDYIADTTFDPYIHMFNHYCIVYNKSYDKSFHIQFGDIGVKAGLAIQPDLILINKQYWNITSIEDHTMLVFHELGHLVFYKDHADCNRGQLDIMCPILLSSKQYIENEKVLLDKFFN